MRSTSVTTRKTPAAAKRTADDPFATPSSRTGLHQHRSSSVINPSTITNTRPRSSGRLELTQQPQQAEVLVRSRLALEVDVGGIPNGPRDAHAGEQARVSGQVETPAGATTPSPGPSDGAPTRATRHAIARIARGRRPTPTRVMPSSPAVDAMVASASMESPMDAASSSSRHRHERSCTARFGP